MNKDYITLINIVKERNRFRGSVTVTEFDDYNEYLKRKKKRVQLILYKSESICYFEGLPYILVIQSSFFLFQCV